jgi:hypothetical protein
MDGEAISNEARLGMTLDALGPLRDEVVLLGGASTRLLITDPASAGERPTGDVDVITANHARGLHAFEARLRGLHFAQHPELDGPICRWRRGAVVVDVMPVDGAIFGFSSRWYRLAWDTAERRRVAGHEIRVVTAVMFVATKLEAFDDRGDGDYQASHDLEDVVAVVDGRPELVDEIRAAPAPVRAYLAARIGELLGDAGFVDALAGHLPGDEASQDRLPIVVDRLRRLVINAR